jgi:hypothetical protein
MRPEFDRKFSWICWDTEHAQDEMEHVNLVLDGMKIWSLKLAPCMHLFANQNST